MEKENQFFPRADYIRTILAGELSNKRKKLAQDPWLRGAVYDLIKQLENFYKDDPEKTTILLAASNLINEIAPEDTTPVSVPAVSKAKKEEI